MIPERTCAYCDKELMGRSDKKFCDPYCKSAFHYQQIKASEPLFIKIDKQLKHNRNILKAFNKAGKATVRAHKLTELGFDPNFFTHYWKNQKGEVYLFVYEYGFLTKKEHGKAKYVLVIWQDYMGKQTDKGNKSAFSW